MVPKTVTPYPTVDSLYPVAPPLPTSCPSSTTPVLALKIAPSYVTPPLVPVPTICKSFVFKYIAEIGL